MNNLTPLDAILATLDPKTPHEHRSISQSFLENIKRSREGFGVMSNLLFHSELLSEVHLMCLTILHEWIKLWWAKLSLQEQLEVRAAFSQLFSDIALDRRNVSNNFGSKLSSILTELAERHFPQQWDSMITDFSVIWTQSSSVSAREIIVKTLQFLYTDCTDTDFSSQLLGSRRQEILTGLKLNEEIILNLSFQYLGANVMLLVNQPEEVETRKNTTKSICLTMELLLAMMPVVQTLNLLKDDRNFLLLLLKVLYFPETQGISLQLLQQIFNYEYEGPLLSRIIEWVVVEKRLSFPQEKESFLAVIKAYSIAIVKLLASNIKGFTVQHQPSHELLQQLLSELLQCFEVESHRIVGETLVDFTKMYRYEKINEVPFAAALLEQLLRQFTKRCLKPDFLDKPEHLHPEWFGIEFEDVEDFNGFHTVLLSHAIAFSTSVVEKFPLVVVAAMKQQLSTILATAAALNPSAPMKGLLSQCQVLNSGYLHPCTPVMAKTLKSSEALYLETYQIVDSVIQFQTSDLSLLGYKFRFLYSLVAALEVFHEERRIDVFLLLQQCFSIFRAVLSGSQGIVRDDQEEVRFLTAIDQIGESLAGLIPKFLKFVTSDEVLLSLLNEVNDLSQLFDLPVVKKHMREVLVTIAETAPQNFPLQRQILSVAFEKELQRLSLLIDEACLAPSHFRESLYCDFPERNKTLTTLNEIYFSFTLAAAKIHFPSSSWNSSVWNHPSGVTVEGLLQAFPIAFLWQVLLEKTLKLLQLVYQLSTLASFNETVSRSGGGSPSELIRLYGPSHIDLRKYLKSNHTVTKTSPPSRSKESLRSLCSTIYKTLGLACRQRVFYYLLNQSEVLALLSQTRGVENWHFVVLNRYFLSSYVINLVPAVTLPVTTGFASHCSFSLERFLLSWQGSQVTIPGNLWLESDSQYLFLSHHLNFLFPQYDSLETEVISTLKDNIRREVLRSFSELLGALFGLRGPLATPSTSASASSASSGGRSSPSTENDSSSNQLERQERVSRRRELLTIYFSASYRHSNSQLVSSLCPLLLTILSLGDATACKEMIGLFTVFLYFSLRETDFIAYLANDVFREVLSILLRSEGWAVGLEWELIELLLELYRVFVVGVDLKAVYSQLSDVSQLYSLSEVESLPQASSSRPLHEGPRLTLLQTSLVTVETVQKFESDLLRVNAKKKQRDLMKDLVRTMMAQIHDPSVLSQLGSSLVTKTGIPSSQTAGTSAQKSRTSQQSDPDLRQDLSSLFTA